MPPKSARAKACPFCLPPTDGAGSQVRGFGSAVYTGVWAEFEAESYFHFTVMKRRKPNYKYLQKNILRMLKGNKLSQNPNP